MERPKSRDDVAVFVDFENVYVSVREKFDAQPNFELIMDRCEDYGRIVIARAYADWYRYPRVTSALFANGVEPMYVPTYYYDREVGRTGRPIKNSVDIHLCIDAMRTLYTQTHIDKFVLVTGDRDFIPLVNAIRQHGKEVIIIGIGGAASAHLAQSGDEFLFYEQIADLKSTQQRQEQSGRGERRERAERERAETNGRTEAPSRAEKAEAKRERQAAERAEKAAAEAAEASETAESAAPAAPERNFFDTLVDAINLARQRGFVSNLGSLKVLMRELDSSFHESKAKDSNGRSFSKFKDFVKEAERQGKVQIFTNGTVTEVFLPGEDPLRVSQFAEDLASQQAERELESELEQEESRHAPEAPSDLAPVEVEQAAAEPSAPEPAHAEAAEAPAGEAAPAEAEPEAEARPTFGEREWQIFRGSLSQFNDPVRFADIFSALRGLRNQEVFDLTNNELKEMVKQAINRGMLQRTGRGARAYYRLSTQYRISHEEARLEHGDGERREDRAERKPEAAPEGGALGEVAAGQVDTEGRAPEARRRGRSYEAAAAEASNGAEASAELATPIPDTTGEGAEQLQDTLAEQVAVQTAEQPAPPKPRRNRRKKAAPAETEQPVAESAAPEAEAEQPEAPAEPKANGKKRRSRRKKPAAAPEGEQPAAEAPSE